MKYLFQSNFLTHILNSVQTFTSLTIYNTDCSAISLSPNDLSPEDSSLFTNCLAIRPVGKSFSTLLLYRDGESRGQSMSGVRWNKAVHKGRRVGAAAVVAVVEGGRRKERRLSLALWQPSASRVQGRPLCFFALPSLLLTRPGLFRGMQKLEKRPDVFPRTILSQLLLLFLFLSLSLCMYVCMYISLPPPWVFCYLFFCLTFAYKDVRIVEVAARGWGSKEWFTLGPFFLFLWK